MQTSRILRKFDYSLPYSRLNLRKHRTLYRVGRGEQGVLLVQPYKSEILPLWRFKNPKTARASSLAILKLFKKYKSENDFVGMDMARKFLQMGHTRARRYANHRSGKKYGKNGALLPFENDRIKAQAALIFKQVWKRVENDPVYSTLKIKWKQRLG